MHISNMLTYMMRSNAGFEVFAVSLCRKTGKSFKKSQNLLTKSLSSKLIVKIKFLNREENYQV